MSNRMSAPDRLRRLLAVLPWVAGVGGASLDEIADRFDYPRDRLQKDLLEVVFFVGVYPYEPGDLIEVTIDPDTERVTIEYADYFKQSLQLTPNEALALVGAGAGLIAASGNDDGPLARGITKLADLLDIAIGETVEVELGKGDPQTLSAVREAIEQTQVLRIDYYTHGRDDRTERSIEPVRVFARDGSWYVNAWCRRAEDDRVFRLDRIHAATLTDEVFTPRDIASGENFAPHPDDPRVTLVLDESAAWVADYYPVEESSTAEDGSVTVTLAVTAPRFLERILLQLGPHVEVVSATGDLPLDVGAAAARRVLARYRR